MRAPILTSLSLSVVSDQCAIPRGSASVHRKGGEVVGERLVIAEVLEYSPHPNDWVYLRILHCEGHKADDYRCKRR